MKPETGQFIAYARAMPERGKRMLDLGLTEDAGRAAYLACFHAAQAYICERQDRAVKTYRGVRNTLFLLTGHDPRVDPELRNFLARAFELKGVADYATDPSETTTAEDAAAAMQNAARFVAAFAARAVLDAGNPELSPEASRLAATSRTALGSNCSIWAWIGATSEDTDCHEKRHCADCWLCAIAGNMRKNWDGRAQMPDHDVQSDAAEMVFRRTFCETLAAGGCAGAELDRKVEELMNAPARFRLDLDEDPSARDIQNMQKP